MAPSNVFRRFMYAVTIVSVLAVTLVLAPPLRSASDPVPPPSQLVPQVDFACYRVSSDLLAPREDIEVPLLNGALAPWVVMPLLQASTLCLPVMKNRAAPPPAIRAFVQRMALICYQLERRRAAPGAMFDLEHLNPVLLAAGAPLERVSVKEPDELCLPVEILGEPAMPPEVRRIVQHLDLLCYPADPLIALPPLGLWLRLDDLNRMLFGRPSQIVQLTNTQKLCFSVFKSTASGISRPPGDIDSVLKWMVISKYRYLPSAPPLPPEVMTLKHLNPLFAGRPSGLAEIRELEYVGLPVALNGQRPQP